MVIHFSLTDHAVERYRERVRPCLTVDEARRDLSDRVREAPEPILGPDAGRDGHEVRLGDDITVVFSRRGRRHWVGVTCIAAGHSFSHAMRDALANAGLLGEAA